MDCATWNISKLNTILDTVLEDLLGITSPYLYFGMYKTFQRLRNMVNILKIRSVGEAIQSGADDLIDLQEDAKIKRKMLRKKGIPLERKDSVDLPQK